MAQLMPLPLTVSCFSEIQIGFTFLVLADPGSPGERAIKRIIVKKLNSLKHLVRTTVAELHNYNNNDRLTAFDPGQPG